MMSISDVPLIPLRQLSNGIPVSPAPAKSNQSAYIRLSLNRFTHFCISAAHWLKSKQRRVFQTLAEECSPRAPLTNLASDRRLLFQLDFREDPHFNLFSCSSLKEARYEGS